MLRSDVKMQIRCGLGTPDKLGAEEARLTERQQSGLSEGAVQTGGGTVGGNRPRGFQFPKQLRHSRNRQNFLCKLILYDPLQFLKQILGNGRIAGLFELMEGQA